MQMVLAHPASFGFVLCWALTVVVMRMPRPTTESGMSYRLLYGGLNFAAGCLHELLHAFCPAAPLPPECDPPNPTPGRVLQMPHPRPESQSKSA